MLRFTRSSIISLRKQLSTVTSGVLTLAVLSAFLCTNVNGQEGKPIPTQVDSLAASHPRLLMHDSDIAAIKLRIKQDAFAREEFESLHSDAEALLNVPPYAYDTHKVESTLLWTSREIEARVLTLAGVYRLTGDRRFADRAVEEMLSASRFPNWNPSHFLDTAELTAALGIGYDWLYPVMKESTRQTIRRAIIQLGIEPFTVRLDASRIHYHNNWIQVLYGGETVGALAIAEKNDPASMERLEKVIGYSRPAIADIMKLYSPDGGFEEGSAYWNYATIYNVLYLAALDSAIGTDYGASDARGFDQTPIYRIQSIGPTWLFANFGDCHPDLEPAPQMYWFANRFHRSDYSFQERPISERMRSAHLTDALKPTLRFKFLGLLWYALGPKPVEKRSPDKVKYFSRINYLYMRTAWNDPNAWYAAFRGGSANLSHSHLDLGSFILDGLGQRWAIDLGPDSYELPDYFGPKRWTYFRLQTFSHNTLTVNGQQESPASKATILRHGRFDGGAYAVMAIDDAYPTAFTSWRRGLLLKDTGGLVVQDEYTSKQSTKVIWHFHTRASITISSDGRSATLEQGGKTMYGTISAPSDARFAKEASTGGPGEKDNSGVSDLTIHCSHGAGAHKITVTFTPTSQRRSAVLPNLIVWK